MDYQAGIKKLPKPSPEQVERFVQHVLDVHSWYKHLPLLEGEMFTVFLEPNIDRYVFPTNHPKIPFGNNTEGYIKSFGYLSYQRLSNGYVDEVTKKPCKRYEQDFLGMELFQDNFNYEDSYTHLPDHLRQDWSFKLFPYCRGEFTELIEGYFNDGFEKILRGVKHEQTHLLIEIHTLVKKREYFYSLMSEQDDELLYQIEEAESPPLHDLDLYSNELRSYILFNEKVLSIESQLIESEESKILNCVNKVVKFHKNLQV